MTGEEMERAIEFILQHQATLEEHVQRANERIEQTQAQLAETNRLMQMQAASQSALNEMLTRSITTLAEAQAKTEAKVDRLAGVVGQLVERLGP